MCRHVVIGLADRKKEENQIKKEEKNLTITKTFTTVVRKERAEFLLERRTQHPNEGIIIFVEEMKSFSVVLPGNDSRQESKVLDAGRETRDFRWGRLEPPKTVAEFLSEATTIQKTLDMRSRQYNRPASPVMVPEVDAMGVTSDQLRKSIGAVVRKELRKLFPTTPQPQVASLTELIRVAGITP